MASTHRDEISRLELLHAAHPDGLVFPHLADAYRRAGRYSQAESVLSAGLRRHADYASAHVVLGRLRQDQGRREEALGAFRRVLELDPHNQIALDHLATLAAEDGRQAEALQLLRRLQRLKPDENVDRRIRALEGGATGGAAGSRDAGARAVAPAAGHPPPASTGADPGGASPAENAPSAGNGGLAGLPRLPEPGEVVTETMAELYARQGLFDRAAAVYRQLLEEIPGDSRLRAKLELVETRLRPSVSPSQDLPRPGVGDRSGGDPPARPERWAAGNAGAASASRSSAEAAPPPSPDRAKASGPPGPPPPSTARERPGAPQSGSRWRGQPAARERPIRSDLKSLLSWSPSARPREAPRLAADAPPSPVDAPRPAVPLLPGQEGQREPAESPARPQRSTAASRPAAPEGRRRRRPLRSSDGGRVAGKGEAPRTDSQMRALLALSDLLVGLLEYRDPFFRGSSSLTRLLATSVGQEMGLGTSEQVDLALSAVLRDLGRLALGGRLLPVPRLNPTGESLRRIERHVDLALHLLEGIELPPAVRQAVRHHHERWDGAGYPDALAGDTIPVLARILAVVDSFTAMVSPRPYRLPRRVPDAAQELKEEAGTRYDPAVVDALLRVIARREQPHLGFVQRHHILLVNADQAGAVVTAAKLCTAGYLAEVTVDAAAARERLRRVPVAALVVSAELGESEAGDFVRDLRSDSAFGALPIVVVNAAGVSLRVRLLECGADVCFPPGISHAELQGTLGALVRRTLRARPEQAPSPAGESTWLALQGDIQDFPLTWLLQVMKYDSRTAAIGVRTSAHEGAVYLRQGDAVHAEIRGGAKGEAALREMLQWRKGRFTVQPDARPREQTIRTSIMHLLLTQAVAEDHAAAGIFGAVSEG